MFLMKFFHQVQFSHLSDDYIYLECKMSAKFSWAKGEIEITSLFRKLCDQHAGTAIDISVSFKLIEPGAYSL